MARLLRDEKYDVDAAKADDPICARPSCDTPKHHHAGGQGAVNPLDFPGATCVRFLGPGASVDGRLEALELAYGGQDAIAKDITTNAAKAAPAAAAAKA